MENCTHPFCSQYPHLFTDGRLELIKEINIHEWFMMGNYTVPMLTLLYLAFVLKIGPQLMDKRKPFNVTKLMRVYNVLQVIYNTNTFLQIFVVEGALYFLYHHSCQPMPIESNPLAYNYYITTWLYMISKAIDLTDTVFFVLRKKQEQISFLHVYHHTVMMLSTWYFLKYIRCEQMAFCGLVNSFVHIFMYSYYFLSSFGEMMRPYLWWKIWVTAIQLLQFVLCAVYMTSLLIKDCLIPYRFMCYAQLNNLVFLYLFGNFFYETYFKTKKVKVN